MEQGWFTNKFAEQWWFTNKFMEQWWVPNKLVRQWQLANMFDGGLLAWSRSNGGLLTCSQKTSDSFDPTQWQWNACLWSPTVFSAWALYTPCIGGLRHHWCQRTRSVQCVLWVSGTFMGAVRRRRLGQGNLKQLKRCVGRPLRLKFLLLLWSCHCSASSFAMLVSLQTVRELKN